MTATFTGTGRGKAAPKGQFRDALEEDTKEDLLLVLEDAVQQCCSSCTFLSQKVSHLILSQKVVLFVLLQHFKLYLLIMFPHTGTQLYLLTMSFHPQPTNKQTFRRRADSN